MSNLQGVNFNQITREKVAYWKVNFPSLSDYFLGPQLLSATLLQEELSHDILTLRIKGTLPGSNKLSAGDPVKFYWGIGNKSSSWIGYVYLIEAPIKNSTVTNVVCIGASYFMKNSTQRVFEETTADVVAKRVAKEHRLNAITDKHLRVFPMITQVGQSDWQFLSRLAKQIGFGFRVEDGDLLFKTKENLFQESKTNAPYLRYIQDPSTAMTPFQTVYEFTPVLAEQSPEIEGSGIRRVVSGIDRNTNLSVSKTKYRKHEEYSDFLPKYARENNSPIFNKIITDEVSISPIHSKQILEGKLDSERYRYQASASVVGQPGIRPYHAIYLDGLPFDMSGYWAVRSVQHSFGENTSYRMDLKLGTEQVGQPFDSTIFDEGVRDVVGELSGKVSKPSKYTLENSVQLARISKLPAKSTQDEVVYTPDVYQTVVPDFTENPQYFRWRVL